MPIPGGRVDLLTDRIEEWLSHCWVGTIGADWITATTHHFTTGAVLTGTSLTALLGLWALALRTTPAAPRGNRMSRLHHTCRDLGEGRRHH